MKIVFYIHSNPKKVWNKILINFKSKKEKLNLLIKIKGFSM